MSGFFSTKNQKKTKIKKKKFEKKKSLIQFQFASGDDGRYHRRARLNFPSLSRFSNAKMPLRLKNKTQKKNFTDQKTSRDVNAFSLLSITEELIRQMDIIIIF